MNDENQRQRLAQAVAKDMYGLDEAARSLAIHIDGVGPGHARARMTVREDMLNSHRICHGGMIFTLADSAFAYACNAENKSTLATTCSISFASAAELGEELSAVAEERMRTGRTGVYDITVRAGDGRMIAVFRGNSYQVKGETVPGLKVPPPSDDA
ncbi:MAG: hydroxyphenylacetyl-CoA thioesterase PaaI [Rhodospirillales bacterium]|jgi:acyl-CoA thioesterase|nr:hydroxyphenylacetyl-CoA thioesterase PaaI [Rhodospirillales bacterium]